MDVFRTRAAGLKEQGLWRERTAPGDSAGPQGLLDLRSNDYLGLGARPVSRETLLELQGLPLGSLSSRVVVQRGPALSRLETLTAEWLGQASALVFSSGYAANVGVVPAIALAEDLIFSDSLNHASLIDGCRLSRARVITYPHCDLDALETSLHQHPARGTRWVLTESYFSMDGDSPDLRRLAALCEEFGAGLIVDESHAVGVFGPRGGGLCSDEGIRPTITVAGLGKAVGSQGAVAAGDEEVIEWLWNRARTHFFSTGLSPVLAQLSTERIREVMGAARERSHLMALSERLRRGLGSLAVELPPRQHGPLFSLLFNEASAATAQADVLRALGLVLQPIRPPTVAQGTSRLRLGLRADLSYEDIDRVLQCLNKSIAPGHSQVRSRPPEVYGAGASTAERSVEERSGSPELRREPSTARSAAIVKKTRKTAVILGSYDSSVASSVESQLASEAVRNSETLSAGEGGVSGYHVEDSGTQSATANSEDRDAQALERRRAARTMAGGDIHASWKELAGRGTDVFFGKERWVVVGCGTEVGKTYVTCSLVRAVALTDVPVAGLKPIESGLPANSDDLASESDAKRLERASFHVKHPSPHPLFGFSAALSPSIAARKEGQSIELEPIEEWLRSPEVGTGQGPCIQIIETAGGLFSPLSPRLTNLDLTIAIVPERIVLVAADRLGVLHEVVATLTAMEARGVRPDWVVLSAPETPDHTTGTNGAELERFLAFPWLIGKVVHLPRGDSLRRPPWLS